MKSSAFQIWPQISNRVHPGQSILNWTAYNGYRGDAMEIIHLGVDFIEVDAPNAKNLIRVSREDFEKVWEVWSGYKAGKVQRQELTPITRNSKYVISILHWMEEKKNLPQPLP